MKGIGTAFLAAQVPELPPVLVFAKEKTALDAVESHDPSAYYARRAGLWVSDEFLAWVATNAKPVKNLPARTLSPSDLGRDNTWDREITPLMPQGYQIDDSELCAYLAQMLDKQPNGAPGELLNDGKWNFFYTKSGRVVGARWDADGAKWRGGVWLLGDGYWFAGRRGFSGN